MDAFGDSHIQHYGYFRRQGCRSTLGCVFVQEHLACFFPGNMALGVWTGAVSGDKALKYLQVAKEVAHTCNEMYVRMPSGD